MIRLELPAVPSTNNLYATSVRDGVPRRYLVRSADEWKQSAVERIRLVTHQRYVDGGYEPLVLPPALAVRVQHHWKLSKKKRDLDNGMKLLLDALALGLGCDDSQFRHLTIERVDLAAGQTEHVVIEVESLGGAA